MKTVILTISARLPDEAAKKFEKDLQERGKLALSGFDLNDETKHVLLTWNFIGERK